MYYRHHSEHWLQKWFSAGSLMTLSLILVFWDLTLNGLWPLEMMKTLISCILNNTGLLPGPWILPLQWRVIDSTADGRMCSQAVLCCYEMTMRSVSAQGDLFPGPSHRKQKYVLTTSSSRQISSLVKPRLASSSSLWKGPSVRTCTMISVFELLLSNFTVGIYFQDCPLCIHRHPSLFHRLNECSKRNTTKTVLIIMKINSSDP